MVGARRSRRWIVAVHCWLAIALAGGCSPADPADSEPSPTGALADDDLTVGDEAGDANVPSEPTSPATHDEPIEDPNPGEDDCRLPDGVKVHEQFATAFGSGPVYTVLGIAPAADPVVVVDAEATRIDGLRAKKIMWVAHPSFTGSATVRAIAHDGGTLLLAVDGAEDASTASLEAFDTTAVLSTDGVGTARDGWRVWPSTGVYTAPGCYGLAVQAGESRWEITFRVEFAD